jgi:hypothetical protein
MTPPSDGDRGRFSTLTLVQLVCRHDRLARAAVPQLQSSEYDPESWRRTGGPIDQVLEFVKFLSLRICMILTY